MTVEAAQLTVQLTALEARALARASSLMRIGGVSRQGADSALETASTKLELALVEIGEWPL